MNKPIWRPLKYTKQSFQEVLGRYLDERKIQEKNWFISISDFCIYAGITREYLSDHRSKEKQGTSQDFSDTIKRLTQESEAYLERNALMGKINISMAIFSLKHNHHWSDKVGSSYDYDSDNEDSGSQIIYLWLPPSQFVDQGRIPR